MSTTKLVFGTKTVVSSTALDSLASATYVNAGTIDISAVSPADVVIEVEATPGTVAGNKQLAVFVQISLDGTSYSTGPTSGTTATNETDLFLVGVLPLLSNATLQRKSFSVATALGFVPPYLNVIIKNDSGAALAASGHQVAYSTVTIVTA